MHLYESEASLDRLQRYRETKSQKKQKQRKKTTYMEFLVSIFFQSLNHSFIYSTSSRKVRLTLKGVHQLNCVCP